MQSTKLNYFALVFIASFLMLPTSGRNILAFDLLPDSGFLISPGPGEEDPYLPFAEVMPEPVGGIESIYKKITYPEIARKAGLEGKVYIMVFVNESGGVDNVKVVKGLGGGCDEAAVKACKDIKFTPGKNKGVPVKVKRSLPIVFKLR